MRRRVVIASFAFAAFALAGCRSGSARLEGTWKGTRADGIASDVSAAANTFASQTTLVVKGDQITLTFPRETQTGKYKIVREDKSTVVIVTDKDGPNDQQTFTFVD